MKRRHLFLSLVLGITHASACAPAEEEVAEVQEDVAASDVSPGTDTPLAQDTTTEDVGPPDATFTDGGAPGDATPPAAGGLLYGYFAIHLDPGSNPGLPDGTPDPARPVAHLDELTHLVEAADVFGHKLTLMFTAQWAAHMVSPVCEVPLHDSLPPGAYAYLDGVHEDCLSLVRAFEANGHEVAFHHHPEDAPNNWDGFSNVPAHSADPDYLGTVDDVLTYVSAVAVGGTTTVRAGTTEEYPQGTHHLRFMGARGPMPYVDADDRGDLASTPCAWNEDDNDVWRFRMRAVGTGVEAELNLAHGQLAEATTAYTAGFITHAKDVDPLIKPYEDLFGALDALGITLEGLTTVAGHYSYTAGDPASDADHGCPADEALTGGPSGGGPPGPPGPPQD